jgi:hypothetical protein
MTKEWSALENPPVIEHKYYAKGIGQIMTTGGTGKERWRLSLVEIQSK